jgi:hypothetical protein
MFLRPWLVLVLALPLGATSANSSVYVAAAAAAAPPPALEPLMPDYREALAAAVLPRARQALATAVRLEGVA